MALVQMNRNLFLKASLLGITAFLLAHVFPAYAQITAMEAEEGKETWQEASVELPSFPLESNLHSFYVSPTATQTFQIDLHSIAVTSDGVIRYTLVSTSRNGAVNISHEGIRCESQQRKLYAVGNEKERTWSKVRFSEWLPINPYPTNRQHAALAEDYFCTGNTVSGTRESIAARLQNKQGARQDPFR